MTYTGIYYCINCRNEFEHVVESQSDFDNKVNCPICDSPLTELQSIRETK